MNKKLYLIDFDGTLTKVDTLFDFFKHSFFFKYIVSLLLFTPFFICVKINLLKAENVKKRYVSFFLKDKSKSEIRLLSETYFQKRNKIILRSKGIEYLKNIDKNDDVFIVSASLDLWLEPFAEFLETGLICTEAEFDNKNIFTGYFKTLNCNYIEKKNRILAKIDLSKYEEIIAFGDSKGDLSMFSIANRKYLNYFN